jgi:hypothetical protein
MPATPNMNVQVLDSDGAPVSVSQTDKGTPIFQPSIIPPGYFFYGTGAFDDVDNGTRGNGPQIALSVDSLVGEKEETITGQFLEHVYILGGYVGSVSPGFQDWVSLHVNAPASSPEDRTGTNDGNANKVAVGSGVHIIVPAPADDGDWNVDGAALLAGEINEDLVPVPNASGQGYWNWDPEQSPSITPVANPAQPDGTYDLYDFPIVLARQANRYPCIHAGDVTPAASIKGKKILPHWQWVFTVHRHTTGNVNVAIRLDTTRKLTI